jgi:two-component system, cell cycle sensor histidine kinase and response regulator CckA
VVVDQDGQDGLAMYGQHREAIHLVLSDLVMPRMGGKEFYQALDGRDPQVKFVIMTGYPPENEGRSLLKVGITAWIAKPFAIDTLSSQLRAVKES